MAFFKEARELLGHVFIPEFWEGNIVFIRPKDIFIGPREVSFKQVDETTTVTLKEKGTHRTKSLSFASDVTIRSSQKSETVAIVGCLNDPKKLLARHCQGENALHILWGNILQTIGPFTDRTYAKYPEPEPPIDSYKLRNVWIDPETREEIKRRYEREGPLPGPLSSGKISYQLENLDVSSNGRIVEFSQHEAHEWTKQKPYFNLIGGHSRWILEEDVDHSTRCKLVKRGDFTVQEFSVEEFSARKQEIIATGEEVARVRWIKRSFGKTGIISVI